MKSFKLILFTIVGIWACEKEHSSPGNGAFGYQILSMGLLDWKVDEIKIFSGSKGVVIDGIVRGGGLKSASVVIKDTITNEVLYQKNGNNFVADQFKFQDTLFFLNVIDTITARISIEGKDENEMGTSTRLLKIGK